MAADQGPLNRGLPAGWIIRRLRADSTSDVRQYWEVRNQSLLECPDAFTSSFAEGLATPPERLALRFGGSGRDDFVMGVLNSRSELVGCSGFEREAREKVHHKGAIIGMAIIASERGKGLGKALLSALIDEVRRLPGLEQVVLTVTASNVAARRLYLQAGFKTYGIETRSIKVNDHYFDKELMQLML